MTNGMKPYGFACVSNSAPSSHSSNSASVQTSTTVCSVAPPIRRDAAASRERRRAVEQRLASSSRARSGSRRARPATRSSPSHQANSPCTSGADTRTRRSIGVPRHLVRAVAEDRAVDLVVEVELLERVRLVHVAQRLLRAPRPLQRLGRRVLRVDDELQRRTSVYDAVFSMSVFA